jgi:alkaline phosphatase
MLRKVFLLLLLSVVLASPFAAWAGQQKAPKRNVIIMVADGAGFNAYAAASMYQGKWDAAKGRGTQVYNGSEWKQLAVQTFPLNTSKKPQGTGQQDPAVVYDPAKAWDPANGYQWLTAKYTDSAASATALSTGKKTFNNAINWSDLDQPLKPTMSE